MSVNVFGAGETIHIGKRPGVRLAGGGGFAGAYDAIPSITAAYGMRRLRTAYTGNLLRLRRSSDNAEQDFGYVANGDLDVAAIATFVGGGSGFVTTWYDQSGSSRNAVQTTAANQPLYAANVKNGHPVAYPDGNDLLSFTLIGRPWSAVSVSQRLGTANEQVIISNNGIQEFIAYTYGNTKLRTPAGDTSLSGYGTGFQIHTAVVPVSGGTTKFARNGGAAATGSAGAQQGLVRLMHSLNGYLAEIVVANAEWSDADRQAASAAANAYWGVY